jgi:hypothetical protein
VKIYNYIKGGVCEPILAETRPEADKIFIKTFDIEIDDITRAAPKLNQIEENCKNNNLEYPSA